MSVIWHQVKGTDGSGWNISGCSVIRSAACMLKLKLKLARLHPIRARASYRPVGIALWDSWGDGLYVSEFKWNIHSDGKKKRCTIEYSDFISLFKNDMIDWTESALWTWWHWNGDIPPFVEPVMYFYGCIYPITFHMYTIYYIVFLKA
jgi:hypothetical protein